VSLVVAEIFIASGVVAVSAASPMVIACSAIPT